MWCRVRMVISWTNRVRNEVLRRVKEERNILFTTKRRKADWIDSVLRSNYVLKHVTEERNRRRDVSDEKTKKKT
jgi:hypothetical protein